MNTASAIVITAASRSPHGAFNGQFSALPAPLIAAQTIRACSANLPNANSLIDSVIMGNVLSAGLGQAPARQAALHAGLNESVPSLTLNKMCGSGMQSIMSAHDSILAGSHRVVIAGGMENMTRAPYLLPQARQGHRLGHHAVLDHMMNDGLEDAYDKGKPMGYFAEQCVRELSLTRAEQDAYAERSLTLAADAQAAGHFDAECCPITLNDKQHTQVTQDETIQPDLISKIRRLKPVFSKDGTITAANASSIADGASALLLTDANTAAEQQWPVLARIHAQYTHAGAPAAFPTAPIAAIQGVLSKSQWSIDDIDLFEINEAFAMVPLAAQRALHIPLEKLNIRGGACALGHPIGASGARILVTLIHALRQRQQHRGIAAACIGGGEATAIAIEIPSLQKESI